MKISKARLKQIINEEVQNYKRNLQEGNAVSRAITQIEKTIGFAIAADKELDFKAQPDVAKNLHRIIRSLEDLHNKMHDFLETGDANYLGEEDINEGQPAMYPEEVQTVAQVVEPVAKGGGDLTAIGDALEQAGLKIQRGYRYIMVFVKYAKIMIAPTSAVELEGNETVIGKFAVGEMQE